MVVDVKMNVVFHLFFLSMIGLFLYYVKIYFFGDAGKKSYEVLMRFPRFLRWLPPHSLRGHIIQRKAMVIFCLITFTAFYVVFIISQLHA